jgi:RimJ/RimL family protein N-acetyltransferase
MRNKTEIRLFRFGDYVRFLKVRLSPKTMNEFSRSLLGYFIVALKDASSRIKVYKFSVYYNDRLAGFGAIYSERGFDELDIFILPAYRRKGIATEATKGMIDYCFTKLRYKKINTVIPEKRAAAEGVVKKLGFKLVKKDKKNKFSVWRKKK